MKKQPSLIIYPAGAYGNFLAWCCCNFNKDKDVRSSLKLTGQGAAHYPCDGFCRFEDSYKVGGFSNQPLVVISHPETINNNINLSDTEFLTSELSNLRKSFSNIIYIYSTVTSAFWMLNNTFYKIRYFNDSKLCNITFSEAYDKLKAAGMSKPEIEMLGQYGITRLHLTLDNELNSNVFKNWNKNSAKEMELWELRECCSQYFYNRTFAHITTKEEINELKNKYPAVLYIDVDNLRSNFNNTINAVLAKCNIPLASNEELNALHKEWLPKQQHINADIIIEKIVSAIINNDFLDWQDSKVTFFDEFCIQRRLYDANIEIKCYKLDIFPTNTDDFEHYLIRP